MNGYEKRTETKKRMIQQCALDLFEKYGFEKVTLAEISKKASVSRATIYKYFQDKDNLRLEILKNLAMQTTDSIENIINSNSPFSEKLKRIILLKKGMTVLTNNQFIDATVAPDGELGGAVTPELLKRISDMMQEFIHQGKSEGFIHSDLTNKTVNNYFKLIRAGLKQLQNNGDPLLYDQEKLEDLFTIYINGLKYGTIQKLY